MNRPRSVVRPIECPLETEGPLDLAIVILSYNTLHLLRDCLHSVFASDTSMRYRVYVVDNGSTDGSIEMVQAEFPAVQLIVNPTNRGYSAGNNVALRRLGFGADAPAGAQDRSAPALPRFVLLLNSDTVVPPGALDAMVHFLEERPTVGVAGPRVRRPDGSLDLACRRSFPTPQVSFYRMVGLSRLFPKSRRFNEYNLQYLPEDAVHPVDSVVGAFMLVRREAILEAGLLDERFFMYGEDLDWAKRIKDAGWEIWYNGQVEITHVKEASSRRSGKSRVDFYEAMWLYYRKHHRAETGRWVDRAIALGIALKGGMSVARYLWDFCAEPYDGSQSGMAGREAEPPAKPVVPARTGVDGR